MTSPDQAVADAIRRNGPNYSSPLLTAAKNAIAQRDELGGLYLVCSGKGRACGRLPLPLEVCPCCSAGVKQTRGWTWINPALMFASAPACKDGVGLECLTCPAADPAKLGERAGLLWIGAAFYPTVEHFDAEAGMLGISRRIKAVPRGFELGKTWVLLAHPKAIARKLDDTGEVKHIPGVFRIFKPERIEKIVTESQAKDEAAMEKLREDGITPVSVPDDDKNHRGTVFDKPDEAGAKP